MVSLSFHKAVRERQDSILASRVQEGDNPQDTQPCQDKGTSKDI